MAITVYNRGNAWNHKGDYDRAIADHNEAIRLNPQDALAYNNRGTAWGRKGDYGRAIADFNDAVRLNPQYAPAYNNRGNAWNSKGDYDRAIADYSEAVRLNPEYAPAYDNRGNAWNSKGDYDRHRSSSQTRTLLHQWPVLLPGTASPYETCRLGPADGLLRTPRASARRSARSDRLRD